MFGEKKKPPSPTCPDDINLIDFNSPVLMTHSVGDFMGIPENSILRNPNGCILTMTIMSIYIFRYFKLNNLQFSSSSKIYYVVDKNILKYFPFYEFKDKNEMKSILDLFRAHLIKHINKFTLDEEISSLLKNLIFEIPKIYKGKFAENLMLLEKIRHQAAQNNPIKYGVNFCTPEFRKIILTLLCVQKYTMSGIDKNIFLRIIRLMAKDEDHVLISEEGKFYSKRKVEDQINEYLEKLRLGSAEFQRLLSNS